MELTGGQKPWICVIWQARKTAQPASTVCVMLYYVHTLSVVQDILHASHPEWLLYNFVTMSETCI